MKLCESWRKKWNLAEKTKSAVWKVRPYFEPITYSFEIKTLWERKHESWAEWLLNFAQLAVTTILLKIFKYSTFFRKCASKLVSIPTGLFQSSFVKGILLDGWKDFNISNCRQILLLLVELKDPLIFFHLPPTDGVNLWGFTVNL